MLLERWLYMKINTKDAHCDSGNFTLSVGTASRHSAYILAVKV